MEVNNILVNKQINKQTNKPVRLRRVDGVGSLEYGRTPGVTDYDRLNERDPVSLLLVILTEQVKV